jgi:ribosomal protein L17
MSYHGPKTVTERIRTTWSRQKELLHHLDHGITRARAVEPEEGTHVAEHVKRLVQDAEMMSRNIEATERLLQWFEEQVRQADEVGKDDARRDGA